MAGDWRDPLVGRDVLIGTLVGLAGPVILDIGLELVGRRLGAPATVDTRGLGYGAGYIGWTFFGWQFFLSLLHGMGYALLLLLLTLALRREWLAGVALWTLFMLPKLLSITTVPPHVLIVSALMWGLLVFVVARVGMLAMSVLQFFYFMNQFYPYTANFSAWYAGSTLFALVVCIAFAAYGFHASTAGRPLFREGG